MESIKCPICCSESFTSKELLLAHLVQVVENISCPLCSSEMTSIQNLILHLSFQDCHKKNTNETVVYLSSTDEKQILSTEDFNSQIKFSHAAEYHGQGRSQTPNNGTDVNNMYLELLNKHLISSSLQNQEMKLVHDGDNEYVILPDVNSDLISSNTVVTKNNDGTISLTNGKDINPESAHKLVDQLDKSQEQTYSCNTCGVTFTSVLDHIQKYHNDQDVVVADYIEDNANEKSPNNNYEDPIEPARSPENQLTLGTIHGAPIEDSTSSENHLSRRMITETGDIIEEPVTFKLEPQSQQELQEKTSENWRSEPSSPVSKDEADQTPESKNLLDKENVTNPKRFVIIDKFCDSFVKDIKNNDDKKEPYHRVVIKEMQTLGDASRVKVYNCLSCHIYVSRLEDFKDQPCKARYVCPHCPAVYDNSKSLCAHMKVHKSKTPAVSEESVEPFKCELCATVFRTSKSLKLHKRMHDPVKTRPIEPPVSLDSKAEVSKDKFLCSVCDKLIPIDYRTVHQNSHKNENMFNCKICNRKFHASEYLEMHMKVHNLDKAPVNNQEKTLPYSCFYCSRKFARPHEKVKHERIHTGEKPHSCEICGKSFRVSYCLTLHMRTHTGARPYVCKHCGKRFKAHSVYNHHLLTHSEVRAYKCPFCPKAFKTSVQLAGHKNSHTKPFSCLHCNRPFASLYAVRVHAETHMRQNNLKFSCSLCGASYARTFALKDHLKQVHNQDLDNVVKDWTVTKKEVEATHNLTELLSEDKSE